MIRLDHHELVIRRAMEQCARIADTMGHVECSAVIRKIAGSVEVKFDGKSIVTSWTLSDDDIAAFPEAPAP